MLETYGKELILDLHNCDPSKFNRADLKKYYRAVMKIANVEAGDLVFWDYHGFWRNVWWSLFNRKELKKNAPSHVRGTTAVQFILTSSITLHAIDDHKSLYLNFFSCDNFNAHTIANYTRDYFKGEIVAQSTLRRE